MKFNIEYKKEAYVKIGEDQDIWQEKYEQGICLVPHPFLNIIYKYKTQIPNIENIDIFIETGTFTGFTAEICSKHFKTVYTVEKYPQIAKYKKIREQNKNINFYQGDSPEFLTKILDVLNKERCVILLDAHSGDDSPLLDELNVIKQSLVNNHVIIVDDTCDFGRGNWPTEQQFNSLILDINPNYKIVKTGLGRETILIY